MDAGGTNPWMESIESSLERRPMATHGDKAEVGIVLKEGLNTENKKRPRKRGLSLCRLVNGVSAITVLSKLILEL